MKRLAMVICLAGAACATPGTQQRAQPPPVADAGAAVADDRLPGEDVLATQPAIPPLAGFALSPPVELALDGGLSVLVVERPQAPIQAFLAVVTHGSAEDPPRRAGLASLTAAMLRAGSAKKTQAQIAALANSLGTELVTGAGTASMTVGLSGLSANAEPMMKLLADVLTRPNFDRAEWTAVQQERVALLTQAQSVPQAAAGKALMGALYGPAGLGQPSVGTIASVKAMTLDEVKALWSSVVPKDVTLIAVGPLSPASVLDLARASLGAWRGGKPRRSPPVPVAVERRPRLVMVEFPGRPQTVLAVGQPGVPLSSPDAPALDVMNVVLGASFTSRLNQNLREQHGYSYGAGSRFAYGPYGEPFVAQSAVKTEVSGAALKELLFELERVAREPLTDAELAKGKSLLTFGLVQALERSDATAAFLARYVAAGVPTSTLATLVQRIDAVTTADVQAAVRRVLDPATMTIVLAGDPAVVDQLGAAGLTLPAPQRRGPEGELK